MKSARASRPGRFSLLLGLLGLAALLQLPASLPLAAVNRHFGAFLRFSEASGYWWSGQARLFVRSGEQAAWQGLGGLRWQFGADGLRGSLGGGRWHIFPAAMGLGWQAENLRLPAAVLLAQPALGLPASGWAGEILLARSSGRLTSGMQQGEALLRWQAAGSSLLGGLPLGDHEISLQWQDARAQARWTGGLPGQLAVKGELAVADGTKRLLAEIDLPGDARPALLPYLQVLARPVEGQAGRYRLEWRQ